MNNVDPRIEKQLRDALAAVLRRSDAMPSERLAAYYATFRDRFGPDKLRMVDGEVLLQLMHSHGNRESLVYWLEFKNDEEFPGQMFGSISGGSAHKFGLFRRKDSGQWVKGSPQNEENISEAEAIEISRHHRDQLVAGAALLDKLSAEATDDQYQELQTELDKAAPDISGLAWTHKYFSLLFSDKLDDYHNHIWQRFNLIKILQLPPKEEGLYVAAGRFVRLARLFGWPMNHLTFALNERNGRPINYWRIGTRLGEKESIWPAMRDGGYIAIGWDALGDLSSAVGRADAKDLIREKLTTYYSDARILSRKAGEIRDFVTRIAEGDTAVAADGQTVIGIGRVTGSYRYENNEPTGAPHRRTIDWLSTAEWDLPDPEGQRTTVFRLKKHESNLMAIERGLLDKGESPKPKTPTVPVIRAEQLGGTIGRVQLILERKGQVILYGPPGTGKTYWARKAAFDLASLKSFGRLFDQLAPENKNEVEGTQAAPGLVRSCTFHPAYGYEDFLEGFRPHVSKEGGLTFYLRDGIFKKICVDARKKQDRRFVLIVDEINRGDIPRIFGELLTLLELDKRGTTVTLPLSQEQFSIPPNLNVIGTMNTADRSIALLDTALRRRFGFVELMPDIALFGSASVEGSIPIGPWLAALNERIRAHLGRDARNLQIGHAYLMENSKPVTDFVRFVRILAEDIVPLLEEYCYEDYGVLARILGQDMVDERNQRIREELFLPSHRDELVRAMLAPAPEVVTSPDAAASTPPTDEPEEADGDER